MAHPIIRGVPARASLVPPELEPGMFTLTQPHLSAPVGWLWVSQNGALEDWVVTSEWREPAPGNPSQDVTFDYVAPSGTVTSVAEFLAWIHANYPVPCASITERFRHNVQRFSAQCPS